MVKYQFLQQETNVYLPGERSKRRGGKRVNMKQVTIRLKNNVQKYFNTKRKQQRRGADKVTDSGDIK